MARTSLLLLTVAMVFGSAPALGQIISPSVQRGPFAALACGISLDENARPSSDDQMLVKFPEDQSFSPMQYTAPLIPGQPNYAMSELFPNNLHLSIEIDAHSTGNDIIPPPNTSGVPAVTGRWLGITVTTDNLARGAVSNSYAARRFAANQPRGADLSSYFFKDSFGLDPSLPGRTFLEQSAENIRFASGEDIDAIDFALGVLNTNPANGSSIFFYERSKFFFSVTKDWAVANQALINFAWDPYAAIPGPAKPDGAVIYMLEWEFINGAWGWGQPEVYRDRTMLNLHGSQDDVDGIAIDLRWNVETVVFSTQVATNRSQLQIQRGTVPSSGPYPLTERDGVRVTNKLGLRDVDDNIIGICTIDPEPSSRDAYLGIPGWHWPRADGDGVGLMGISMTRGYLPNTTVPWAFAKATGGNLGPGAITYFLVSGSYPYDPANGFPHPIVGGSFNWGVFGPFAHPMSTGPLGSGRSTLGVQVPAYPLAFPVAVVALGFDSNPVVNRANSWITFANL